MTKFLRFNQFVLNPRFITKIIIEPNKYSITMCGEGIRGGAISGSGWLESASSLIEVDKNKNPICYEQIRKWIDDVTEQ